jgi:hypothetical protein
MRVDDQRHAPAALPPRKTRYPLYRRLGWPQEQSGQARKEKLHRSSCKLPVMLVSVDEAASGYHYNTKQHSLSLSFQFTIPTTTGAGHMYGKFDIHALLHGTSNTSVIQVVISLTKKSLSQRRNPVTMVTRGWPWKRSVNSVTAHERYTKTQKRLTV